MKNKRDLFRGCLIGGAIGDALGYEVEFDRWKSIKKRYGEDGIRDLELKNGKAIISDDTQMTLFTAEGLAAGAKAERREDDTVFEHYIPYIWGAYQDWYLTQDWETQGTVNGKGHTGNSWLYTLSDMHHRRAPGNTCLSAIAQFTDPYRREQKWDASALRAGEDYPTTFDTINNSMGCGGVMRTAPVGLFFDSARINRFYVQKAEDISACSQEVEENNACSQNQEIRGEEFNNSMELIDMLGAEAAALTHGHPLGYIPSATLVHIVNRIVYRADEEKESLEQIVKDAVEFIEKLYDDIYGTVKFADLMRRAAAFANSDMDDHAAISMLGEGWTGHDALAIAVFAALRYKNDFRRAIQCAVNHDGDSDSTGAIAGNILGAYLGYEAIRDAFETNKLELRDEILEMADRLYEASESI